eukprot:scaffold7146_cov115-Isochrysis_galbana.AAC.8
MEAVARGPPIARHRQSHTGCMVLAHRRSSLLLPRRHRDTGCSLTQVNGKPRCLLLWLLHASPQRRALSAESRIGQPPQAAAGSARMAMPA